MGVGSSLALRKERTNSGFGSFVAGRALASPRQQLPRILPRLTSSPWAILHELVWGAIARLVGGVALLGIFFLNGRRGATLTAPEKIHVGWGGGLPGWGSFSGKAKALRCRRIVGLSGSAGVWLWDAELAR